MTKSVELINFQKNPGKTLDLKQLKKKVEPFFTIYTFYNNNINIETINSVLNQTYNKFEWFILANAKEQKEILKYLQDHKIDDKRIIIKNKEDILSLANSEYLISLDFDTYLDRCLLEMFYTYITYYGKCDVIYTNVISIDDETCYNSSLISLSKKIINFSTKSFCYHKNAYNHIKINDNGMYSLEDSLFIVHFNYYGVWHQHTIENKVKIKKCAFKNFPSSTIYNFDTIPSSNIIDLPECEDGKNILAMVPWHKIGGADLFNYNIFKYLKTKGYHIYLISTEVCNYEARMLMEDVVDAYYDLTTFLDRNEWANFIKSLVINKKIKLILQLSSLYGYYAIPWLKYELPDMPILDYIHVENYAWRNGGFPRDSVAVSEYIDKTYCCNNHLEKLLYDKMGRTIHNTETLYIGVDTDKYNPDEVEITDTEVLEFCKGKKVLLYPCRFCPEKRPIFLLNVMKKIKESRNDIVCLFVGDGESKKGILDYINQNKLDDVIKIVPLQSDIRQYYKIADLTVIVSLFEGITLTTYESLSMNTPVISADIGGEKEVINDKVGKIIKTYQNSNDLNNFNYSIEELQEYEDNIINILDNIDKYTKNNNCRNHILNKFSIKKIYSDFESELDYYIENGSNIPKYTLNNKMNAAQYLVLFNETTKVFYNNSILYENFKNAMRDKIYNQNKLWQHWWYRWSVKIAKKLKIDSFIKKIMFKR